MTPNRERVWVGLFVVIASGVLIVTVLAVWGGARRSGVEHRAYFKFSGGVEPGTAVRYGGMKIGSIRSVKIDPADSTRIEIDMIVDGNAPLKTDSVARLSTLGPLSDSYVEISTGTAGAPPLPPGAELKSMESVGLAQLGDTIQSLVPQLHDALDKLALTLDGLQTTVVRANDLLNDSNRASVSLALSRTADLLNDRNRSNLSASLDSFHNMLDDTRPKVSKGLDNLNDVTARLTPLLNDLKSTSANADKVLSTLNTALVEDQPEIRGALSELRQVLQNSAVVMNQLQTTMNQNTGHIDDILENMRLSTENIRSLTETLKVRPASLIRGVNAKDRKPGGSRQ